MADPVRETMDGTLGYFWTDLKDVFNIDKASNGYVRLVDDELFHVGTRARWSSFAKSVVTKVDCHAPKRYTG